MEDVIVYDIDSKKYLLSDKLKLNNTEYLFLSNIENPRDIVLRKIVNVDSYDYVCRLNGEEFDEVMIKFYEKNKNLYD